MRGGIEIAVTSGAPSPDGNGQLALHYAPTINAAGQLAFVSDLTSTTGGSADNQALYRRETSGEMTLIARRGQSYNGQTINVFFPAIANISTAGVVSPIMALSPSNSFTHVFGSGGPLTPMYTAGSPSPTGNNTLLAVLTAAVNDAGVSVFRALYNGSPAETGLYQRAVDGTLTTRLLQNSEVPRGGLVKGFSGRPTVNESGQIGAILTIDVATKQAAARLDGATVKEFIREGDLLADGITTLTDFKPGSAYVSDGGHVAFVADYSRTTPTGQQIGQGVFRANDSGVTIVAPGLLPGGSTAANNMVLLGISATGRVALTTEFLGGGSDPLSAVYVADTAGPTLVAFEDTATPAPGKYFRGFFSDAAVMNDAGQLAFLADLSDVVNGPSTGRGLFLFDPLSGLKQIAATGDAIEDSTINSVFFMGSATGDSLQSPDTSHSGLNNAGTVAFAFSLANGEQRIATWTNSLIAGDYNGDGMVDTNDYTIWQMNYGTNATAADGNGNSLVDAADYVVWRNSLSGENSESSRAFNQNANVPEPSTLAIMAGIFACWPCFGRLRVR